MRAEAGAATAGDDRALDFGADAASGEEDRDRDFDETEDAEEVERALSAAAWEAMSERLASFGRTGRHSAEAPAAAAGEGATVELAAAASANAGTGDRGAAGEDSGDDEESFVPANGSGI